MSNDISLKLLSKSLDERVLVKLRNGRTLRGLLKGYDQHMNLFLEDAEELGEEQEGSKLGSIVLRGDNIVMVSPHIVSG